MTVGQKIKALRKKKGITQKELANITNIAEITIRQYEADKYLPKTRNLTKIAHALDSTIGELLVDGWKADKSPEIQFIISSDRKKRLENIFDSLNALGQDIAIDQVEMLAKIPEYQKSPSTECQTLNAAHNEGATEEQKANADRIMNDDSEWE